MQQFEFWLSAIAQARTPATQLRNLADGLADLLDSQQVFVLRSGRRARVIAASGLESFDPRSETIMAAQTIEREVHRNSTAVAHHLDLRNWNADVNSQKMVENLHALMACDKVIRLRANERSDLVALLAFNNGSMVAAPGDMNRIASALMGLVDPHAGTSPWLRPFRTTSQNSSEPKRSLVQLWTMRLALVGLSTVIAVFPVPQQVSTTAVLAPTVKSVYYAQSDATVIEVLVNDQQDIKAGDVLLTLRSPKLERELRLLQAEQEANLKAREYLNDEKFNVDRSSPNLRNIISQIEQIQSKIKTNKIEQARVQEELAKLNVIAVQSGKLSTWDIQNRLFGRPVRQGDTLLSTFQPDGDWDLQVSIPEHRAGLVKQSLEKSDGKGVRIRFSLTSHPEVTLEGRLAKLPGQATRNASGANVVLGTARVAGELPLKKEGAIARVTNDCGRVPAIWLVIRDAYWACVSRLKMIW